MSTSIKRPIKSQTLFNPGPTNVSDDVWNAMNTGDLCHREPEFSEVFARSRKDLIALLGGEGTHEAVAFVSSGTGCNEAVLASTHGDLLIIENGKYSQRLIQIAKQFGMETEVIKYSDVDGDWERLIPLLEERPSITTLVAVLHETTTGETIDPTSLAAFAKRRGVVLFVDAISSVGAYALDLAKTPIDFLTVSCNKGLQSLPGLSFVVGARDKLKARAGQSRSHYFDLYDEWRYQDEQSQMRFTPCVQLVFAAGAALAEFRREGVEARVARYQRNTDMLRAGLQRLGFELDLNKKRDSRIISVVKMRHGYNYWGLHDLLKERGFTLYSDAKTLARGVFRVAAMGALESVQIEDFLTALKSIIHDHPDLAPGTQMIPTR
jgi:2-aminoethylphosphonate-pyruvate transaminase